jgi:TolA-binding protein
LHKFLSGIGGEQYAARVLHRLSRTFFDQARYARAVEAYRMLLASEPDDANAPQYLRQIAAGYAALEDPEHTLAALTELAHGYGAGSAWAQKQADPATVTKAEQASERAVRLQAMRYHQRAQKDQSAADFEHAAALYRVHTEAFPNASATYEVTFYLAELLFHRMNRPEEAGDYYLKAARLDPKGKFSKDALYNAVVAFEAVRVKELAGCGKPQPAAAGSATACAETPTDKKFSEAVALYTKQYPDDPEVPGILFRQGRMYFDRGIYDPAIRQFGQLLDSYPQSEYAATAGELVLESFNRAQDFSNIEAWARKLKRAPAFQNGESQKKLDALILQSVFKSGEQLAAKGQHQQAAQAYLRATEEFPNDERAPKAYFNAGQEWQLAGDLAAAASAYDALIEQHPGTTEGALGAWSAAQMFESIAQFKDAARYYEAYAARFPQGPKREDAYYNALVLRVAAADNDKAVRDGNEFLKAYPNSTTADEAYFLVGKAHEAEKRWNDAAQTYRHYIKNGKNDERKLEAQTRLGKVLAAQGDRDGADKAFTLAAKGGRKSDRAGARYHAAEARFLQGDQALAEFEKIKIEGDVAGLRKRLAQKSELLRKAADVYGDVVDYRVSEWVAAALYKVGQSYELFADSLRKAPVPAGLSEAEEQAYRDELSKVIVPIEERALEAYESGYRKALELHVFNAWTQKQREALTRLNDVEYPPLKEAGAGLAEAVPLPLPEPLAGLQRPTETPQPTAAAGTGKSASKPASKSGKKASGQAAPPTGATPKRPAPSAAGRP